MSMYVQYGKPIIKVWNKEDNKVNLLKKTGQKINMISRVDTTLTLSLYCTPLSHSLGLNPLETSILDESVSF